MDSTIPYDPSLVLGHLVTQKKIDELAAVAECTKPQTLADRKLENLKLSSYKMNMVFREMDNFEMPAENKATLEKELNKLDAKVGEATLEVIRQTIKCQTKLNELLEKESQKQISVNIESPLDFALSPVQSYPLSSDTMNFDVQYFRNEGNKENSSAHVDQVTGYVSNKFTSMNSPGMGGSLSSDVKNNMVAQTSNHSTEGTIVIVAYCTHRASDIITPIVLDPEKTLSAWNATFPKDKLRRSPESMFKAALREGVNDNKGKENVLQLLTGCTRASSFIGFVHISQTEKTNTSQSASALASGMKSIIEKNMAIAAMSGEFGAPKSMSTGLKNLMSNSVVENHCSLITQGVIANIAGSDVKTAVMSLKPDPQEIMAQQSAISAGGEANINNSSKDMNIQSLVNLSKSGAQYMELNSKYASETISKISELATENNKVIDTNSMFTAFTDYIARAQEGKCGIPINFFIKTINKAEVASTYINRYFPNGAATSALARKGTLGQESTNESK